ncbi:DUF4183 domain-containing protein [Paenibacillus anaericanus]|uniref:DUF4183 domain-containing protein n=1 Tax=Paenibacillus anaericanus TaxID=170367 RepID=A0A3S1DXM0_9BACL|nr:DUF4183 domain-containing protein [Paenibacillus anaericanus]RUT47494.1 DUF4183 domain-containing protein [Paenibacillus anaericanus]
MAVIKPVYTATSSAPLASGGAITTNVTPVVTRYLAIITAGMISETITTIPAASFTNDTDGAVVTLPLLTGEDYFNVYLNGTLQQGGLSTLTTADLVLAAGAADINAGVPVLLEVADFQDATSTITTQVDISAPVITIIT